MKKIVAAINFQDDSRITIEHAVQICLKTGAELEIFHAITTPSVVSVYGNNFGFYTDREGELAKLRLDKVHEWMKSLGLPTDFKWKFTTRIGLLSEQLDNISGELVIMGPSKSLHLGQKGKVYRLVRDLQKPVLFTNAATNFQEIKQVIICQDYQEIEDWGTKLMIVKELALAFEWDIHILHIKSSSEVEVDYRNARITKQYLHGVHCYFHTLCGEFIPHAIEGFAEKEKSLITILPREQSFLNMLFKKSVSKEMLGVDVPLLILHPT
jgi:hypothetical protein